MIFIDNNSQATSVDFFLLATQLLEKILYQVQKLYEMLQRYELVLRLWIPYKNFCVFLDSDVSSLK